MSPKFPTAILIIENNFEYRSQKNIFILMKEQLCYFVSSMNYFQDCRTISLSKSSSLNSLNQECVRISKITCPWFVIEINFLSNLKTQKNVLKLGFYEIIIYFDTKYFVTN